MDRLVTMNKKFDTTDDIRYMQIQNARRKALDPKTKRI